MEFLNKEKSNKISIFWVSLSFETSALELEDELEDEEELEEEEEALLVD